MDALEGFLTSYGLAAACVIMLVKAIGVPIPIPGDVILLALAARAAEGKVLLWLAFVLLLAVLTLGGTVQYLLARGPARRTVLRYGGRLGITAERLERVAARVKRGGIVGIGLAVLTPGVRTAAIPGCGLANVPLGVFVPGLALGSSIDIALHFALGLAGAGLLAAIVQPSPLAVALGLAAVGLAAWLIIARRRHMSREVALNAWAQATCPVCLIVGSVNALENTRLGPSAVAVR
ncbi:MAG TPA: VTT domain-containing protein [Chloroflexota bacterium]|jgi:membrane protein DedA with SNARE-associated domain